MQSARAEALLVRGQVLLRMGNVTEAKNSYRRSGHSHTNKRVRHEDGSTLSSMEIGHNCWAMAAISWCTIINTWLFKTHSKDLSTPALERFQRNEIQKREMETAWWKPKLRPPCNARAQKYNVILSIVSSLLCWHLSSEKTIARNKRSIKSLLIKIIGWKELNHEKTHSWTLWRTI